MQAFARFVSVGFVLALGGFGCGGNSESPDARVADGSTDAEPGDPPPPPLDAFSSATKAAFHLIVDGKLSDGRTRVDWAPKIGWLQKGQLRLLTVSDTGTFYQISGLFDMQARAATQVLEEEARVADLALVPAEQAMPRLACEQSSLLTISTSPSKCGDPPKKIGGVVTFTAVPKPAVAVAEIRQRIATHLADGGAWDDVIVGDLEWHAPGGEVLHTKLEVSCIGNITGLADVELFNSAECRARYGR